jgi:molybdate transport system substrate-binding protein
LKPVLGSTVLRVYDTAGATESKFIANDQTDLLITTEPRLLQSTVLQGGTIQRVGDTLAGAAVSSVFAARYPNMQSDTPEGFKQALLAAKTIVYSDPTRGATVGAHFIKVIDALGIRAAVLAKANTARDGIETMQRVASGEADLGITQVSEIVQSNLALLLEAFPTELPSRNQRWAGADLQTPWLLGAFPAELELATRYSSWVADNASAAVQALALAFRSESGRSTFAKFGLRVP